MANETTKPTAQVALDSFDFIRIAAMFVIFIASFFREKRSWPVTDAVVEGAFGLIQLCAPFLFLKQQVLDLHDDLSELMVRVFGALLLLSSLSVWRTWRKSRDDIVISALVYARFISVCVLLMVCFYYLKVFRPEHAYFVTYGVILVALASGLHLVRYANPLGGSIKRGLPNMLLRVEFLVTLVIALAHLTFPEEVFGLAKISFVNDLNFFWTRACGAILLFYAMLCLYATSFRQDRDRNEIFLSRFCSGLFFMALNYVYYCKGTIYNKESIRFILVGHLITMIPSAIGVAHTYDLFNLISSKLRFRIRSEPTSYNTRSKRH